MITRLDNDALNEVVGTAGTIKTEVKTEEKEETIIAERRSLQVKSEPVEATTQQFDVTSGTAWQKLMNLLMQLRKVCNQWPVRFPS